jgi:hypothetical protein
MMASCSFPSETLKLLTYSAFDKQYTYTQKKHQQNANAFDTASKNATKLFKGYYSTYLCYGLM